MDYAISATPVADRCIKSSTPPCNLHRQILAVKNLTEELSDFQHGTIIGCHLSNKSHFCPAWAASVNCKCCYCEVEMFWSNNGSAAKWSVRPHKFTERDRWVLKHIEILSSVATLTTKFQPASGSNVSTRTVCQGIHEMGFHGRAASHKPKITMTLYHLAGVV